MREGGMMIQAAIGYKGKSEINFIPGKINCNLPRINKKFN